MLKLYYSPGACSLSPHIVLREVDLPFTLVKTDVRAKKTEDGRDFLTINPMGYVPALEDNGTVITEGPVVVQYIANKAKATTLAPPAGTLEGYRLQSWLNFITSELHKAFSPLFNPSMPEEGKKVIRDRLTLRIGALDKQLAGKDYLMGKDFSVADAYCFTILNWSKRINLDLSAYQNVPAYLERVRARPSVQAALKAEGIA
jgi:glutathione S-transferase